MQSPAHEFMTQLFSNLGSLQRCDL